MICNNCGTSLKDSSRFCSGCGKPMAASNIGASRPGVYETPRPSPVSALFIDQPLPPPAPSIVCVAHASVVAAGACVRCGNCFCRDCLIIHAGRNYCHRCATLPLAPLYSYRYQQTNPYGPSPIPRASYSQSTLHSNYQIPDNPYAQPATYVKRKEPAVAVLLSVLLPGIGQIYNGDAGKGIAFMVGFWLLIWIGVGVVFWIWAVIDAYQSATNINLGRRI